MLIAIHNCYNIYKNVIDINYFIIVYYCKYYYYCKISCFNNIC